MVTVQRLLCTCGKKKPFSEENHIRDYLSTVDKRLHFGLGNAKLIDSIVVVWPNDKQQTLTNFPLNKALVLEQKNALHNAP